MALVRRSTLSTIPRQPGPNGDSDATAVLGGATAAVATLGDEAAAVPSLPARWFAVLAALVMAGAGAAGAKLLGQQLDVHAFRAGNDMSTFAGLFVFAAAVERVLEPITRWLPGRKAKAGYERAVAALANGLPGITVGHVAVAKATMDRHRADRTVLSWGLATGLATALAGGSGFYLLRMIAESSSWSGVAPWIDALVTGLVVGSGTKPLHDLVTRMQPGSSAS